MNYAGECQAIICASNLLGNCDNLKSAYSSHGWKFVLQISEGWVLSRN